jgi:hypothetical protein
MRGERMDAVQKCLQHLFSPGGQVFDPHALSLSFVTCLLMSEKKRAREMHKH